MRIRIWSIDKDGHCSGLGWVESLKEAKKLRKERVATGRDLYDDNAKPFI